MFDRRVKIFLLLIVLVTGILLLRSAQVQVLDHKNWNDEAERIMSTGELIETSRGRLLDYNGNVLAEDVPCIDACVDYRAIVNPPEDKWLGTTAAARLRARLGSYYGGLSRAQQNAKVKEEKLVVAADIQAMFQKLGELGRINSDEMDQLRASIVRKVDMRRRTVWYSKYEKELRKQNGQPEPWYSAWLDDSQRTPELDAFQVTVGDEIMPHVIIPDINNAINNELGKNLTRYPGLVLRPSVHRYYPYKDVAAHVIGHLSKVLKEDVEKHADLKGEMREYLPNDLIGRSGLEALCEPVLRGTRGKIEHYQGEHTREVTTDPIVGADVRTSIDMDLEQEIQSAFEHLLYKATYDSPWTDELRMPGAAIVLDVATNQVRAMVSYPSYDLNELDEQYSQLAEDRIEQRLINRATQFALEPGSTVKPMVGLAAITQGLFGINDTVECTGYLQLSGRTYWTEGRCWVAKSYESQFGREGVKHHPFPSPHETGFLTYPDALERSCNVFFETLGDRLGIEGISYWFDRFGLGRPTGIGIAEVSGLLPIQRKIPAYRRRAAGWFAAIGQDQVNATPIQMANVAATIARNGIWMRPTLLADKSTIPSTQPDRVDMNLSQAALAEAHDGMTRVVNGKAGTGLLHRTDVIIAGKTGTAQAAKLSIPMFDADKQPIMDETPTIDAKGTLIMVKHQKRDYPPLGTHENPNPQIPWYRGAGSDQNSLSHAWFIGFAPAENPKIAFAVMVEYGGSGGTTAGFVVNKLIDACVEHGYLQKR